MGYRHISNTGLTYHQLAVVVSITVIEAQSDLTGLDVSIHTIKPKELTGNVTSAEYRKTV